MLTCGATRRQFVAMWATRSPPRLHRDFDHTRSRANDHRRVAHMMPAMMGIMVVNLICCRSPDTSASVGPIAVDSSIPAVASAEPLGSDSTLPPVRTSDFVWGVDGHPLRRGPYSGPEALEEQFAYLDSLRVTYYRVDVHVDTVTGEIISRGAPLSDLLDVARRHHVHILPLLLERPNLTDGPDSLALAMNRHAGYRFGYMFAIRYGKSVSHVEAGNELERLSVLAGEEGSDLAQYDPAKLARTVAFLHGMTDGIHAAAPDVKVIIDASAWRHYAFFEALDRDSVDYDVVGYHWYSGMGDIDAPTRDGLSVLQHLTALHKDIWITEIDRLRGSYREDSSDNQAYWIAKYAREFYGFEQVKAFFVYELYDEHYLGNTTEAYYGLVTCSSNAPACTGAGVRKPAFDAYRYAIEEQVHGYADYVYALFVRLLHRPPSATERAEWTNRFLTLGRASRSNKPQLIAAFLPAADTSFVRDQFQLLAQRQPSRHELTYWLDEMARGASRRDVIASLCDSSQAGIITAESNMEFVTRLFRALLHRAPTASELTTSVRKLAGGTSRMEAAMSLLSSDEFYGVFIDQQYQALYGRSPTSTERTSTIRRMRGGLSQEGVIAEILGSRELWRAAIMDGYARRTAGQIAGP